MVRVIDVCSGKGGVGKTTLAANLGIALQRMGLRVALVDCNLTTSHLGLLFGIHAHPNTLNGYLRGESTFEQAIYTHFSGLKIVPASLRLGDLVDIDTGRLRDIVRATFIDYDVVILDSAPGLGREALIALGLADEVLFVAEPYMPSLVDVLKAKQLMDSVARLRGMNPRYLGIVLNRVRSKRFEISTEDAKDFTDLPVIGIIPEDESVLECANRRAMVSIADENSPASKAIYRLAGTLGGPHNDHIASAGNQEYGREGRLGRIFRFFASGLKRSP